MDGGRINLTNSSSSIDSVSILVVDDDITCLAIVSAILKKFNYEVVTVKHPNDALCTLRINGGAFDLVVSDVHMPDMNGFELQQAIAQEFNDLPVVLMSADDKEGVALKGLECGAAFFIMKPVCPDDLRDLWQFAAMKRKNHQNNIVIKETPEEKTSTGKNISDEIANSASSVNEDAMNKKESKRKSPRKEGSDEKHGENSQSSSQKRPKIVWTNSLHNRFLEAIRSIGLDRAVPKKILEVMNVPGLTRENVASHLQKYRIFLRRVSDASYKIQYSSHKKSSCESSRISPQSSLMLNRLSKLSYEIQNRGQFDGAPLPNVEAPSTQSGQSRLLSSRGGGSWQKPSIISDESDRRQNNYLANISLEDHSGVAMPASLDASYVGSSSDAVSSLSFKNLTYQTNYVGYTISNMKSFAQSRQSHNYEGSNSCRGIINNLATHQLQSNSSVVPAATVPNICPNSDSLVVNNNGPQQLCDVIADYRILHSGFENGGEIQESALSPIFDLSELDMLSAQQALEQGSFENTLPDQVIIQNQAQQNNGGETNTSSNFYEDVVHWDHCVNVPYSFNQTPNQLQSSQLINSQGFATSSQLNGAVLLPANKQQVLEGLTNSSDFGTFAQLNKTVLSPTHERNDDDFLESLLLAPFGEDHSLEGCNM